MTNHPGDYHSFLQLARLREDHVYRQIKHRQFVEDAPYRAGFRALAAGVLRKTADRVDRPHTTTDPNRPPRYQRAP